MRTRFLVFLTAACLVLGVAAAAGAGQSPPKPPANDDCLACHGDADAKLANGTHVAVDAAAFAASRTLGYLRQTFDTWSKPSSTGVSRSKMLTRTFSLL